MRAEAIHPTPTALPVHPLEYKTLMENSAVAVILGVDGRSMIANEAACRLFGYTAEEFLSLHRDQLFVNNDEYFNALKKRAQGDSNVGSLPELKKTAQPLPARCIPLYLRMQKIK